MDFQRFLDSKISDLSQMDLYNNGYTYLYKVTVNIVHKSPTVYNCKVDFLQKRLSEYMFQLTKR